MPAPIQPNRTLGRAGIGLKKSNLFGVENQRAMLLYDISIENMDERKAKVLEFPTIKACGTFLGITTYQHLPRYIGKRVTSKIDGKIYALREQKST